MKSQARTARCATLLALANLLGCALQVGAQPPGAAVGPEVTVSQIQRDIEMLEHLNALRLDVKQLEQMVAISEDLGRAQKQIEQQYNLSGTKNALWEVRANLLKEGPGDPWQPMANFREASGQREQAYNAELEKAVGRVEQLLTGEQCKNLARRGTTWATMDECLEKLDERLALEEDEWCGWRDETSAKLAKVAAELSPDTAKGVSDRVLVVLITARDKGPAYVKANLQQLRTQLVATVLPEGKRDGPSAEERKERVHAILAGILGETSSHALFKEKLDARKARA